MLWLFSVFVFICSHWLLFHKCLSAFSKFSLCLSDLAPLVFLLLSFAANYFCFLVWNHDVSSVNRNHQWVHFSRITFRFGKNMGYIWTRMKIELCSPDGQCKNPQVDPKRACNRASEKASHIHSASFNNLFACRKGFWDDQATIHRHWWQIDHDVSTFLLSSSSMLSA